MIDPLKLRRLRLPIAIVVVFCLFMLLFTSQCTKRKQAETEAKIATGQAGAAIESGKDAVETQGNRTASESAGREIVEDTKDALRNANDGSSAHRAGADGLCRIPGRRPGPECVQQPR